MPATPELATKADLGLLIGGARTPASAHGYQQWTFWQFTNKATIAGIPGTADMDEDRFNGSLSTLRADSAEFEAARPKRTEPVACDERV